MIGFYFLFVKIELHGGSTWHPRKTMNKSGVS